MPSNNFLFLASLANQLKVNDFVVSDRLKALMKGLGGKHTYIIHQGDKLIETGRTVDVGLTTFWLGDKQNRYVFVKLHNGANLSGMVSVKMYLITENETSKIVMDVWPVIADDKPILGTIWMDDQLGQCFGVGSSVVFSSESFLRPYPFVQFMGTVNGFCFGMVFFDDQGIDSKLVISNPMKIVAEELGGGGMSIKTSPLVITPLGVGHEKVLTEYGLTSKWLASCPEEMEVILFRILGSLFENGTKIFSLSEIYRILTVEKKMSPQEARAMIKILDGSIKDGWLVVIDYALETYFVPMPKLYVALHN